MSEQQQRNPDELGALWIKQSTKGEFMTGTINGEPVVVFRNTRKQGNQPDWRVLKSKPQDGRPTSAPARSRAPERADEPAEPEW